MHKPKFSIVMPCLLNRAEHKPIVEDCITSIRANSTDYEFIIVDDGSQLPTGFLKEAADTYVRHNPTNRGIAPSWNDGIMLSRGEYVVIINDDIRVQPNWLNEMEKVFLENENVGVVAPAVEHIPHPESGTEEKITWFPGYCYMLARDNIAMLNYKEMETDEPCPGVFDENFVPFNCEDCDYWERMLKVGLKLMRTYNTVIWHAEGDTIHHMDYQKRSEDAIKRFISKHGFDPQGKFYS